MEAPRVHKRRSKIEYGSTTILTIYIYVRVNHVVLQSGAHIRNEQEEKHPDDSDGSWAYIIDMPPGAPRKAISREQATVGVERPRFAKLLRQKGLYISVEFTSLSKTRLIVANLNMLCGITLMYYFHYTYKIIIRSGGRPLRQSNDHVWYLKSLCLLRSHVSLQWANWRRSQVTRCTIIIEGNDFWAGT